MWTFVTEKWAYLVLAVILVLAAVSDIRTGRIRNYLTYSAILVGVIGHALLPGKDFHGYDIGLTDSLMGFAAGFVPLFIAWRAGGIGGGDAKLMGAIGALSGWEFTLASMFYGFIIAGVMAAVVMMRRRIVKRTLGRVWRVLMLITLRTKPEDPATEDSPKIAFGVALCIGAALELLDVLLGGPVTMRLFGA